MLTLLHFLKLSFALCNASRIPLSECKNHYKLLVISHNPMQISSNLSTFPLDSAKYRNLLRFGNTPFITLQYLAKSYCFSVFLFLLQNIYKYSYICKYCTIRTNSAICKNDCRNFRNTVCAFLRICLNYKNTNL